MVTCLTTERVRLVQTVRRKRLSISSLAEELGRNRGAVTRDVKKLAGFGLVQIVEAMADRLVMRADI
jgi:predicted transcriptional regulator